jgi:DeoR/GlpR family transcriptional regulator of sugar metabolism
MQQAKPIRFPQERHQRMAQLISDRGQMAIGELMSYFATSAPTVRRDLTVLEQAGLVLRTHGGVVAPDAAGVAEPMFMEKLRLHQGEKRRIAAAAAELVRDRQSILLDSGTTCLALARKLSGRAVTVVTMDMKVAEAAAVGATDVHLLGGRLRNGLYSLVGRWALEALERINCDFFFMSADAIDRSGISNSIEEEADLKRVAMRRTKETVVIADHSKLDRRSFANVCRLGDIDRLITDRNAVSRVEKYRDFIPDIVMA